MKVIYETIIKVKVVTDIESINEYLKTPIELANDIGQMICDEATQTNSVATYDILKCSWDSSVNKTLCKYAKWLLNQQYGCNPKPLNIEQIKSILQTRYEKPTETWKENLLHRFTRID